MRIVDGTYDDWGLADVTLRTLSDLDRVTGDAAVFTVGAEIDLAAAIEDPDAEKLVDGGTPPTTSWTVDGGVAVASDLDTLTLFTAYAHTERSLAFFGSLGVAEEAIRTVDVHYLPDVDSDGDPAIPESDNAFYFLPADLVALLPPRLLEDIPLAMNLGVITHELAHRVAFFELWGGGRLEAQEGLTQRDAEAYYNLLAVDEGMADYFGAVITGDPRFVAGSIPWALDSRDLSRPHPFQQGWVSGTDHFFVTEHEIWDPYPVGSVLAAALWRTGLAVGHEEVAAAVIRAQRSLRAQVLEIEYEVADLEMAVLRELDGAGCDTFLEGYDVVRDRFEAVCP